MDHCSYDTKHWPCTYCEAPNPKHVDAKCRNEEELYCPLCGRVVKIRRISQLEKPYSIACNHSDCLHPQALGETKEEVIAIWNKYAR